jgi:hypothetical protein
MNAIRSSADASGGSRRDFLKVLTSYVLGVTGVLGLAGIARFLSFDFAPRRQTEFDLGPASDYLPGSRTQLPQSRPRSQSRMASWH